MTNDFNDISIRGRLAYGMTCLEKLVINLNADNPLLQTIVFPKIWEFTSTEDMGEWEQNIRDVDPVCVLDDTADSDLKALYNNLPNDIVSTIEDVIEIGIANIYGGTGDNSPMTLEPLNSVIKTMTKLKVPLPDLRTFKKSSFSEFQGWGNNQTRDYYLT
jgi:hypothetical protein